MNQKEKSLKESILKKEDSLQKGVAESINNVSYNSFWWATPDTKGVPAQDYGFVFVANPRDGVTVQLFFPFTASNKPKYRLLVGGNWSGWYSLA